ncbi:hypothetical protein BH23ACT8_BH23ACT8_07970 [soil metagenome]
MMGRWRCGPAHISDDETLEEFCQRHQIRRLALFGSALRADFRRDSDMDVLWSTVTEDLPSLLDQLPRVDEP